jgi:hypothetical protein
MSPPGDGAAAMVTTTTRRSAMAPIRPHRHAGHPPAPPQTPPGPAPAPPGAARHAARLEALLGDPRDPANPYGRSAVRAAAPGALPAPPPGLPGPDDVPGADQLARALRPLLRRDLALAHAWSIRPLLDTPVPHPAAALLGPAALLAAAGNVLGGATRIVDGLSRHEAAARQWRPVLATVFADLLACESLTDAALRACPAPGRDAPAAPRHGEEEQELLAAVTAYLVPQLALELLGDLELVLNECGFDGRTPERRTLARLVRDRAFAGAHRADTGAAQARIVHGLFAADGPGQDDGTRLEALLRAPRTTEPPGTGAPRTTTPPPGADDTGTAAPPDTGTAAPPDTGTAAPPGTGAPRAAAPPPGADDDAGAAALARLGRRLAAEQRALRTACAVAAVHDSADPAARALADRRALLVLAAATTAARETAAAADLPFLGDAGWALSALGRITVRLGLPLPAGMPDTHPGVWEELARRAADGVDCDLHATRPAW